jgi:hypothetical protein
MKEVLTSSETSVPTRATWLTSQKTPFFIVTAVKTLNPTLFHRRRQVLACDILASYRFRSVELATQGAQWRLAQAQQPPFLYAKHLMNLILRFES